MLRVWKVILSFILLVVVLAGLGFLFLSRNLRHLPEDYVYFDIQLLEQAVSLYSLDCGAPPNSLKELVKPDTQCKGAPKGGYILDIKFPWDLWEQPYHYKTPSQHNTGCDADIWSIGQDGVSGTQDDITNWKPRNRTWMQKARAATLLVKDNLKPLWNHWLGN